MTRKIASVVAVVGIIVANGRLAKLQGAEAPDRKHVFIKADSITFQWGATDDDMAVLEDYPDVKSIVFGPDEANGFRNPADFPFEITDAGFARIANCKKIEHLAIGSSHPLQVTDDGLRALAGLTSL